jgi:hypothetical protein
MIVRFPYNVNGADATFYTRQAGLMLLELGVAHYGDSQFGKQVTTAPNQLPDGDYYLEVLSSSPVSKALFCCRVENQVATIADFWPQLDMLRAMQTGKAYNWTNQANEVLRVAIEEAP